MTSLTCPIYPFSSTEHVLSNNHCHHLFKYIIIIIHETITKLNEIYTLIDTKPPLLYGITDTWSYKDFNHIKISIPNYNSYHGVRPHNRRDGGVSIEDRKPELQPHLSWIRWEYRNIYRPSLSRHTNLSVSQLLCQR